MYLMYVDESGDIGVDKSPTRFFVLSAIVLNEDSWLNFLDDLIAFRRALKKKYGLGMNEEIHASDFVNGRLKLKIAIPRNLRLDLLKQCLKWLNTRNDISIITVRCDKKRDGDIFDLTWRILFQRFENTIAHNNFPNGKGNDKGIVLADNTDGGKLTKLLREMRRYNQIPNDVIRFGPGSRNMRLRAVIEDPVLRDSANSYFHQMVDVVVYFARQYYEPNRYIRKKGARTFYNFLSDVVNPYVTNYKTPNSMVEI